MINLIKSNRIQSSLVSFVTFSGLTSLSIAQNNSTVDPFAAFGDSITSFAGIVNTLTSVVIALAFLFFFWNLASSILGSSEEDTSKPIGRMLWSAFAVFFIVSIWGVVDFFGNIVGIDSGNTTQRVIPLPIVTELDESG